MHKPTGLAVVAGTHRLLVASSNADLLYAQDDGGAILNLDVGIPPAGPATVGVVGALNVESFAGDLAVARPLPRTAAMEPDHCGTYLVVDPRSLTTETKAVFATRGSNTLNVLSVGDSGGLTCRHCGIPSSGMFADPFPVAIACQPNKPRAFIGYLGAQLGQGWVSQLNLVTGSVATVSVGAGLVRALAYDAGHDRLYLGQLATSAPTPLRWVELGGCTYGDTTSAHGCSVGQAALPGVPVGSEIRSIALAHPFPDGCTGAACQPQRAYITVRLFDVPSASVAGGRNTDYGGLLVVLDLVENSQGNVTPQLVRIVPETGTLGRGLQDVRVLPARPGKRDVVAAVAVDEGILWIHDDDSLALRAFGRDAFGQPLLGHDPAGLAVDPDLIGTSARIWIGSYTDSFVTPIDVPLADPFDAAFAGSGQQKITGAMP
jgi:hypothetical protein